MFVSLSLHGRSVAVEFPDRLRPEMEMLFGRAGRQKKVDGQRRIVVREDGVDRFAIDAPFSRSVGGLSSVGAINRLLEEIVRSLVFELDSGVALHAGAVGWRNDLVLVTGPSQAGKSSLIAWLASKGFTYLSDELVVLTGQGNAEAFARPLVVKPGSRQAVAELSLNGGGEAFDVGKNLVIPPARRRAKQPPRRIRMIIFVQHADGADLEIVPLSSAQCVSRLMGCNLNAGNLKDHGLGEIRRLAETCPAVGLRYAAFDQLSGVVDRLVHLVLANDWVAPDVHRLLTAFRGGKRPPGPPEHTEPAGRAPPKSFPVPAPTPRRGPRRLTIGMATYDDFDGVYFTIQALRLYHAEVMDEVDFLVVDNHPDGPCNEALKKLENPIGNYRYFPFAGRTGTVIRDVIFDEADSPHVLCIDCHVLILPDGIRRLLAYYRDNPNTSDLLQGPLIFDNLKSVTTQFEPGWRSGMFGRWSKNQDLFDPDADPFEIPMQGLGLFSCRKAAWPGFNPGFQGFGGEEFYIHEKFRQAGARTLCLPFLRWVHRFPRPMGVPYPIKWEDRIRNYILGFSELGLPTEELEAHFKELLGPHAALRIIDEVRLEMKHSADSRGA